LKIALLSDTHELHRSADVPACDLLIHAGDWTFFSRRLDQIEDFNEWLGEQHAPLGRILCPGNHETYLERDPSLKSLTSNGKVLISEPYDIHGLKLFATSVVPLLGTGFGIASAEERSRIYAQIPIETDVLISHGPPYGILDCAPGDSTHQGCRELLKAVRRIRPKLHVFGHVHTGFGLYETEHTLFVNAALLGPHGDIENRPVMLSMDKL
jgi:predicted phosphodiesterase